MMKLTAWDKVTIARLSSRPTADFYIKEIFTDFTEFYGDRCFGNDNAIVSGIAYLENTPVTVIAQAKGENTKENIRRNFGMPKPEGYRKALRIMKQASKFGRPIITFVDTQGAFCGKDAEERGQGEAIAKNLIEMMKLEVPVLSIVIGEGGSGGALGIAVANEVWMLENSIYSVISPEGFSSIIWKTSGRANDAAELLKLTAEDLYKFGIIEKIIAEPKGGAHNDSYSVALDLKKEILKFIKEYEDKDVEYLKEHRYNKFRKIGEYGFI